jgi:hypothetical protein
MRDLFVSWPGDAGHHAKTIAEQIRSLFAPFRDTFNVYFYEWDIVIGDKWTKNLEEALQKSKDGIILFSQEAIKSDWLLHECAALGSRVERLTIFLRGTPDEMVPQPLRQFQHRPLSRDHLRGWVDGVIAAKGLNISLKRKSDFSSHASR